MKIQAMTIPDTAVIASMMHSKRPFVAHLGRAALWADAGDRAKIKFTFAAEWAVAAGVAEAQMQKADPSINQSLLEHHNL